MSEEKRNRNIENNKGIPLKIYDAITSLSPEFLLRSESSPSYPIETFNISEDLDNSKQLEKKKEKEKEYTIGNYLIKKTLGQGTFGKVKLGIYLPTGEKVAIKILEKDRIIEKDDEIRVKREFNMLALLNHPNVILVAEIFESRDNYYSVMEYCEGGELFNYIVKYRRLDDWEAAFFYFQLINGLEYIHSLGIVHRDLKPENLLLTKDHLLKIIDFGLSNYFQDGQKKLLSTPCGSPCYASPEMVSGKQYNGIKIDVWSTGIILYAMLCGYLPFEDKDNTVLFQKILECKLIFPKYITEPAKDLMEKILVTDPDKRITIEQIKQHPFYLKGKDIFEKEFSICEIDKNIENKNQTDENYLNINLDNNKEDNKENNNNLNIKNNVELKGKEKPNVNIEIIEIEKKIDDKKQDIINDNHENSKDKNKNIKIEIIQNENSLNPKRKDSNTNIWIINENNPDINNKKNNYIESKKLPLKEEIPEISDNKICKDENKLNRKAKSRETKDNKNNKNINNERQLQKPIIKKSDIRPPQKIELNKKINNNAIKRKMNYTNLINNKNAKIINQKMLIKKNFNNVNNTIDNEKLSNKRKKYFNFQNIILSSIKDKIKTDKNNMKLKSFEDSNKNKKEKICLNDIFNINNKKCEQHLTFNNGKNNKNNFKISSNKNNSKIEEYNNQIKINTIKKENETKFHKNLRDIKGPKFSNNSLNISNAINKNEIFIKIDNEFENNKKIKLTNRKKEKKSPKQKNSNILKLNEAKYIKRTFDKKKHIPTLNHNLNSNSNITENYNYTHNKNNQTNINDYSNSDKNNKISKNISNLDNYSKNDDINQTEKYKRKKILKMIDNSKQIGKNQNNFLNKKKLLLYKNIFAKNINFNTIDRTDRFKVRKKIIQIKKKKSSIIINDNKNNKKKVFHMKKNFTNVNKSSTSKNKKSIAHQNKKQNPITQNQPNTLNKTTNNSNLHNFLKNPFINESTHLDTLIPRINYNLRKNHNPTLNSLHKRYKNIKLIANTLRKKKPFISIRNTFINFNLVDTGLFLSSLDNKKKNKFAKICQTSSVYSLNNNRLNGLCKKFQNVNNSYSITIDKKDNNNLKDKKISGYKENENIKRTNKENKIHIKFNSMKFGKINSIEKQNDYRNNKIDDIISNIINGNNLKYFKNEHFLTEGNVNSANEKNKRNIIKK